MYKSKYNINNSENQDDIVVLENEKQNRFKCCWTKFYRTYFRDFRLKLFDIKY